MSTASALANIESVLGDSTTWRTLTGTANATAAKARVHKWGIGEEPTRPFCVLVANAGDSQKIAMTTYQRGGSVDLVFEFADPGGASYEADLATVWGNMDALTDDFESASSTTFDFSRLSWGNPRLSGHGDGETFWRVTAVIEWEGM